MSSPCSSCRDCSNRASASERQRSKLSPFPAENTASAGRGRGASNTRSYGTHRKSTHPLSPPCRQRTKLEALNTQSHRDPEQSTHLHRARRHRTHFKKQF
ncbi:hypothetical protein AAFF_G00140810 [Aldrovandia affinis]|uniref:Uncharacterized protein n=1 Tax=Aldrovandia affinis TaxID=143900 RepID=A0AAD7TCZ5_9TELE|nr:hypothetical protein AAFF_G00140810 [Aldrovandia affinis]